MPRKGDNIYRRKDGRWEGRYIKSHTDNGNAVYGYVYGRTYREAKSKLRAAAVESIADEKRPAQITLNSSGSSTFKEAALIWIESVRSQVKESSYVKYKNLLETYIYASIGSTSLRSLSQADIEKHCEELLKKGGNRNEGLSPKTVSSIISVIRAVLRFAALNGEVVASDAKNVHVKQDMKEMRVLTDSEQDKLCRFLCSNPSPGNIGILLCLFTGLRVGEICALKWEDFSFEDQTIHIHSTMQRIQNKESNDDKTKVIITEPKSVCSVRTIPVPDDIMRIIVNEQGTSQTGFFLTNSQQKYMEPRAMQYRFKKVLKDCDIYPANFHSLRHTFATKCVELGFDVKSLSEILGHASVNITMNRYVHPTLGMKRAHMQRLSLPIAVK